MSRSRRSSAPPEGGRETVRPPGRLSSVLNVRSVAGQVFVLQVAVVILLVAAALVALVLQARSASISEARERSLVGAVAFAHAPGTLAAMKSAHPSALLQPRAEETRKGSGVDYVIAFNTAGIRWTHPDPELIGEARRRLLRRSALRQGAPGHRTARSGSAVQWTRWSPFSTTDGKVVGLVSVGVTIGA